MRITTHWNHPHILLTTVMASSFSGRAEYFIELDEPIDPKKRVGAGAYGAVYEVKLNGASCIAKRLHDILTGSRGEARVSDQEWRAIVDKFRNECSLLSKMRHPNVVQFLGINQPSSDPRDMALIMEKLHMDLEHLITEYREVLAPNNTPPKSSNDIFLPIKVHILRDISCGLLHIHSHGVVHRDLNSGNVLLTESLQAKVADLGVARIIKKSTVGMLSVTPGALDYMPPEATCENPVYDDTLDTFSMGHLMLYLVNCRYPYTRDPSLQQLRVSVKKAGLPLGLQAQKRKRWLDHISEDHSLCKIIVHCLQDEPFDRPNVSSLKTDLDTLCEHLPKCINMISSLLNKRRESAGEVVEKLRSEFSTFQLQHQAEIAKLVKAHKISQEQLHVQVN